MWKYLLRLNRLRGHCDNNIACPCTFPTMPSFAPVFWRALTCVSFWATIYNKNNWLKMQSQRSSIPLTPLTFLFVGFVLHIQWGPVTVKNLSCTLCNKFGFALPRWIHMLLWALWAIGLRTFLLCRTSTWRWSCISFQWWKSRILNSLCYKPW